MNELDEHFLIIILYIFLFFYFFKRTKGQKMASTASPCTSARGFSKQLSLIEALLTNQYSCNTLSIARRT